MSRPVTSDLNVPPLSHSVSASVVPTASSPSLGPVSATGGNTREAVSSRLKRTASNYGDRKASRRSIFYSTDDDQAEVEADLEREISEAYKSGYLEGRRHRATPKRTPHNKHSQPSPTTLSPVTSQTSHYSHFLMLNDYTLGNDQSQKNATQKRVSVSSATSNHHASDADQATRDPAMEEAYIGDHHANIHAPEHSEHAHTGHNHNFIGSIIHEIEHDRDIKDNKSAQRLEDKLRDTLEQEDEEEEEEDDDDDEEEDEEPPLPLHDEDSPSPDEDDNDDVASITSTETFTLRERQDAINITHPFGIRIWKPAVYKKIRSVQRFAEGEIHSGPTREVSWLVWLGNIIWSFTFGIILLLVCWVGALVFRVFFFWNRSVTLYSRTLFLIGKYLFFPFGVSVQLRQDENYLLEDTGEGRTVAEYQEWQTHDSRRLFFAPDLNTNNSQNNENNSVTESNSDQDTSSSSNQTEHLRSDSNDTASPDFRRKLRFFGRGDWNLGRIVFYLWFYVVVYPLILIISLICWLGVFSIPMGKVTGILSYHIRRHPLALSFRPASTLRNLPPTEYSNSILLCTYRALGIRYYKYTIDGTNIFIVNMVAIVPLVIFDYFFLYEYLKINMFFTDPLFIFIMSLVAIVPLAYFIGQAVASISAQSSMGMGATINAFFSTVVEVFLYCVALSQGKGDLVEGSIVGSIFGGILLLPGLSMCFGAIKRKTQRYNPKSAGVSSTMLLFAIIGAFAPTIFYQIYGTYEVRCLECSDIYITAAKLTANEDCQRCHFYQAPLGNDELYAEIIRPFSAICASLLFVSYMIGLWFTLRTHAAMIWQTPTSAELHGHTIQPLIAAGSGTVTSFLPIHSANPPALSTAVSTGAGATQEGITSRSKSNTAKKDASSQLTPVAPVPITSLGDPPVIHLADPNLAVAVGADNGGGHDAPNWSRTKSTVILLGATFMYSLIAEVLVDTVDGVLKSVDISEKFVGVTIFALVPNTTEFLNAISFAMNGNIALSMEIGSAYVLQVCLLQIPALVAYSMFFEPIFPNITDFMFTLVFPRWDLLMVVFCVFVFSYIYAEGKSNYFKGSILVLSYLVVMVGFYFTGMTDEAGISQLSASFSLISNGGVKMGP